MSEPLLVVCGVSSETVHELGARGHRVETADDGYRTIELVERLHPSAVVVPLSARGPEPSELVERVRQIDPSCNVLLLVDEADPTRDAELVAAGAKGILLGVPDVAFLAYAVDRVGDGGLILDPQVASGLAQALIDTVTQRGEWARQLAQRTRQAEQLARAKADFLSNVSHELRTPLTIIKGVAATLRMTDADETQSGMLTQIEKATDNLVMQIESIITQASMNRGEYTVNVIGCDLGGTIRAAAEEAAEGHPNVSLEMAIPAHVQAVADVRAIRGVVRQLVDNACRYSDAGGIVSLKARSGDEGLTVHVTDRGVGVDRDKVAAALAEAFSPGEDVMTKERAGLGLGLNLARNLIALHGGILWAEPLPGGGSRVSFTIPPKAAATAGSGEPSSLASAPR
jgi:signal transduction histidine kinase